MEVFRHPALRPDCDAAAHLPRQACVEVVVESEPEGATAAACPSPSPDVHGVPGRRRAGGGRGHAALAAGTRTTGAASRWPSTTTPGVQSAGRPFRLVTYILLDDQIDPIFSFLVFSDQACSFFVSVTHTIQRS